MHPLRNQKREITASICHTCNYKAKLYIAKAKAQQTKMPSCNQTGAKIRLRNN